MKQKPALFLSIALTVFVMVVLSTLAVRAGGLGSGFGGQNSFVGVPADLQQIIDQREQEYNKSIQEANRQIIEMQAQLDAAGNPAPQAFTPEQAAVIAQDAAMGGYYIVGTAELVEYEGKIAYEVPFNAGNIYVDANTGVVLFNGTIVYDPPTIFASDAARIASDYLKRQDAVDVKLALLSGDEVFKVIFSNGDMVYVSKSGQLLQVRLADRGGSGKTGGNDDHNDDHDNDNDND